jgi:hypothetical protein
MPHPKYTIIPFGCVIHQKQHKTTKQLSLDIFRDEPSIIAINTAFKWLIGTKTVAAVIVATKDDPGTPSPDCCGVLINMSAKVNSNYAAWCISRRGPASKKFQPVPPTSRTDPRMVMDNHLHYFLLPNGVDPNQGAKTARRR